MGQHTPTDETCLVDDCSGKPYVRGWCTKHYQRWKKHGDPLVTLVPNRGAPLADRLSSGIDCSAGPDACHPWTGATNSDGYGVISFEGQMYRVHRLVFENGGELLEPGMEPDHACHTRAAAAGECQGGPDCLHRRCANLRHLQAVSKADNNLLGLGPAAINARKDECDSGHPFNEDNTYIDPAGNRNCIICARSRGREYDRNVRRNRQRKVA